MNKSSEKAGLVTCACWNSHTTLGWKKSGFLALILASLISLAVFLPYITAMARHVMPAFLPFISQAGGTPPMTGAMTVPMILVGFFGLFGAVIVSEAINHRNVEQSKKIFWSNRLSFGIFTMACLGCIITASFPIGYLEVVNKFDWIFSVLLWHSIGASMVLVGSCCYQFLLTFIWWFLPGTSKKSKYFKIALSICYMLMFFISAKPMPDALREILGADPFNFELLKRTAAELPIIFSVSYKISAFCEWAVCIFTAVQFLSVYSDMQRVSFRVVVRHKSCFTDDTSHSSSYKSSTSLSL